MVLIRMRKEVPEKFKRFRSCRTAAVRAALYLRQAYDRPQLVSDVPCPLLVSVQSAFFISPIARRSKARVLQICRYLIELVIELFEHRLTNFPTVNQETSKSHPI
jgi:hypothetical protein